jgi:hypothetical protein
MICNKLEWSTGRRKPSPVLDQRSKFTTAGSSARPHVTSSVAVATANNKPETLPHRSFHIILAHITLCIVHIRIPFIGHYSYRCLLFAVLIRIVSTRWLVYARLLHWSPLYLSNNQIRLGRDVQVLGKPYAMSVISSRRMKMKIMSP